MSGGSPGKSLDIYVAPSCFGCDRARELAVEVRSWGIPHIFVRLRDLADPQTSPPESVFAVPTYLLDGEVVSLGNPDPTWLRDLLESNSDTEA